MAKFNYDRLLDQWKLASGQWQVASGQWLVASGQWQVASGQWQVASGLLIAWVFTQEISGRWPWRVASGG